MADISLYWVSFYTKEKPLLWVPFGTLWTRMILQVASRGTTSRSTSSCRHIDRAWYSMIGTVVNSHHVECCKGLWGLMTFMNNLSNMQ